MKYPIQVLNIIIKVIAQVGETFEVFQAVDIKLLELNINSRH